MIEQAKFWGMPLRTRWQRRLLVVLYYVLFLAIGCLGLLLGPKSGWQLVQLTVVLGGLLGGIQYGAPVKAYEELLLPLDRGDGPQTLNLSGRRVNRLWEPLDERERTERDHAHYTAYRILRWTLGVIVLGYWLGWNLTWTSAWVSSKGPVLAWMLLVYALSLPQSVVLWTEPQGPAEELAEVRAKAR